MKRTSHVPPGFRPVPRTGVIYVMTEAAKLGYRPGDPRWANLGQGAPETGPLPGAPPRQGRIELSYDAFEYSPIDGLPELRERVAALYNARYRSGKKSQYTAANVAISPGGRAALTRLVSTLGRTNVGHFLPDYTAYEELLDSFGTFVPIPLIRRPEAGYAFPAEELRNEILGRGLSTVVLSNPANPTGALIHGAELHAWVQVARELKCTLVFDEFYSHYIYADGVETSSAAAYVEDVDSDPVVILDGLTKNWRYPGYRVAWTIGPRPIIEAVTSAGSFLEGGCSRPMQLAALPLLDATVAAQEALAIHRHFHQKRDFMLAALEALGIRVHPPLGGFYCWGDVSALPPPLNTGMGLFRAGLEHGLITVPGVFFDINPGQRRPERESRFAHFVRFSFGPPREEIERGLAILRELIAAHSAVHRVAERT
ncbi:MAG: pyridoxal phosphate-dependent aminotransferase [Candidatus Binatia bacterium]|nr:pyridoxal phosphate-dependent aminotransferase [Candidatus Binatia bacterium]